MLKLANLSQKNLVRRLLAYLKPYKLQTCLAICLLIITMLCSVINPYLLEFAIAHDIGRTNLKG